MINMRRVGVFISKSHSNTHEVIEGVSSFCQIKSGWKLAIAVGDEKNVLAHLAGHLDGVIAGIQDPEFAAALRSWGKPCVDVFNSVPDCNFHRVQGDITAGGRAGAEHLIGLGFQRFAFCGFQKQPFSHLRQEGFEEKVRQAGGTCFVHQVDPATLDWPAVWKGVADWVAGLPKPIGLMAVKDALALEVLEACGDLGIKVPDQVAVLGMGNDIALCQRANPLLSSVDPGIARIGFQAATWLEEMMSGKSLPPQTLLLPPAGVVGRASTDTLSLADPQMAKILRHICEHACDPMQVNDLLTIVPLSRRSLEVRFFQARGRSLHEEIRRIQLQRAMRLLAQTYLPLEHVARASGFGSPDWMGKVFRKELGVTPGEHRRRHGSMAMATQTG